MRLKARRGSEQYQAMNWSIAYSYTRREAGEPRLGLPIRWVVPLLPISLAGALSMVALFALYWRLAHVSIPAAGQ